MVKQKGKRDRIVKYNILFYNNLINFKFAKIEINNYIFK